MQEQTQNVSVVKNIYTYTKSSRNVSVMKYVLRGQKTIPMNYKCALLSLCLIGFVFAANAQEEHTEKIYLCKSECVEIGVKKNRKYRYEWKAFGKAMNETSSEIEVCPTDKISFYYVNVYNKNGDLIEVYNYRIFVDMGEIKIIPENPCSIDDKPIVISIEGDYKSVKWSNGIEGDSIVVTGPVSLNVEVTTNKGCTYSREVNVQQKSASDIENYFESKGFHAIPIEIKGKKKEKNR